MLRALSDDARSVLGGLAPALCAAVMGALSFDFFHVEPDRGGAWLQARQERRRPGSTSVPASGDGSPASSTAGWSQRSRYTTSPSGRRRTGPKLPRGQPSTT